MPDPIDWSITGPYLLVALAFGYLCGSIPFGLLISRFFGGVDVRSIGSGNIGATNVLRTGNKGLAFATLLADVLKGTIPVLIALRFGPDMGRVAGLGAFLGHCFPIWLRFSGGKGVATYIGVLLGLFWQMVGVFGLIWLGVAFLTRYSSLAALVATLVVPVALYFSGQVALAELFALLTVILWVKHWSNIKRLLDGTEGKIGKKAGE